MNEDMLQYLYGDDDLFENQNQGFVKGTLMEMYKGSLLTIAGKNPEKKKYHLNESPRRKKINHFELKDLKLQSTQMI